MKFQKKKGIDMDEDVALVGGLVLGIDLELGMVAMSVADDRDELTVFLTPDMATNLSLILADLAEKLEDSEWLEKESSTLEARNTVLLH